MLLQIPDVLTGAALAQCRHILAGADWGDGRVTAGPQSARVKNNQQLAEDGPDSRAARAVVFKAIGDNPLFFAAALPKQIFPPLFNRYHGATNAFGNHIDNAIRNIGPAGTKLRTDLSATLFLSSPDDYDGGELVIEDTQGARAFKLPAGHLVLYSASTVHRVEPVTRGARLASFFWVESMVRDDAQRRLLFDMDMAILSLREEQGEIPAAVKLTGCYHNLLRMWASV